MKRQFETEPLFYSNTRPVKTRGGVFDNADAWGRSPLGFAMTHGLVPTETARAPKPMKRRRVSL